MMTTSYLKDLRSPEDVKKIPETDIPAFCDEIRSFLVEKVGKQGGHLASNLGVTELTVAIHRVFESPKDHIIFDVGHQSYVHKILTGRKDAFDTLRTPGGLSGFTRIAESPHDPFGAGHSSTSISAALGFAEADRLNGADAFSVAVLGDGAFTGGMVHEAMNNLRKEHRLVVILNENRMSISKTRGAFASYLAKIRISGGYLGWKKTTKSLLSHVPLIGKSLTRFAGNVKERIKRLLNVSNYFEELGFFYIGPVPGNNYNLIFRAMTEAKKAKRPVLIHTFTQKGKGYHPAEKAPDAFHNILPENERRSETSFHSEMTKELVRLAKEDRDIVAITAAMGNGTGLSEFEQAHPDRYYDVGIAEEHALTFAAGLAAAGKKPFVGIYSTFLQRGYDNLLHDIVLQDLPVRLLIDRAGLAPADGATHNGIFDVAMLSEMPGMRILTPASYDSLRSALAEMKASGTPIAVRYPNGEEDPRIASAFYQKATPDSAVFADYEIGKTPENIIVTYGSFVSRALDAELLLKKQGRSVGVLLLERLTPYGETANKVIPYLEGAKRVLFAEEGILYGGAGMILGHLLSEREKASFVYSVTAIEHPFAVPDGVCDIYDFHGISAEKIAEEFTLPEKGD